MPSEQDLADFIRAHDSYSSLHEAHMNRLRLAALSGHSLDIATFSAEADQVKRAKDELYAKARLFLHRGKAR